MVHLTRIYTRTGDSGHTALSDGTRTKKTDVRIAAYADVDEANSCLGVALTLGELPQTAAKVLRRVQHELFDLGADISTPVVNNPTRAPLRIEQSAIDRLETECDHFNTDLPSLDSFILPGGTPTAAHLHIARTVIRRAERTTWAAFETYGPQMNPLAIRYLNRLSDLVFIMARVANRIPNGAQEVLWIPGSSRQ